MERDFLGLNWKESGKHVKPEKTKDICKDSVTGMQWPLANKSFSLPHIMPSKAAAQEDKQRKIVYNSLTSSIFLPVSTGYAFDCNSKPPPFLAKKNVDVTCEFPLSERMVSVGTRNPISKTRIAITTGPSLGAAPMKQRPLGEISVVEQLSNSPIGGSKNDFLSGTIDLRNKDKPSGALAQLTIFYAEAVHVYDNISPEKAEAIMCFAGNGCSSMSANTKQSSKPVVGDNYSNQAQCPEAEILNSRESTVASFVEGAVPQARRASLARFLEKRKDRLKNVMPYSPFEIMFECTNPQFNNMSSSFVHQRVVTCVGFR